MVESSSDLPGVTGAYRALLPRKAMAELQKLAADAGFGSVTILPVDHPTFRFYRLDP